MFEDFAVFSAILLRTSAERRSADRIFSQPAFLAPHGRLSGTALVKILREAPLGVREVRARLNEVELGVEVLKSANELCLVYLVYIHLHKTGVDKA